MLRPAKTRIQVSPGFVLLLLWFGMVNGWDLLVIILLAAAVHEAGHGLVLRLCGADCTGLRIGVLGAVLETRDAGLSYGQELLLVLAGPAANLMLALWMRISGMGGDGGVGVNLVLALFNLLPIYPLDGGRALYLLTAWAAGPAAGTWAIRWIGGATAAALCAAAGLIMGATGGSLWLLPPAVGAAAAAVRCLRGNVEELDSAAGIL